MFHHKSSSLLFIILFLSVVVTIFVTTCTFATKISSTSSSTTTTAPLDVTIQSTVFNKLTTLLVPKIVHFAKNMTIPPLSLGGGNGSSAFFNISSFKLTDFDIASVVFKNNAPNLLTMSVNNLSIATPHVDFVLTADKVPIVGKITCKGTFWASTYGASSSFDIPWIRNGTTGNLDVGNISKYQVVTGNLSVNHKLDGLLCDIGEGLIELLLGNLDKDIKKLIEKGLGPLLADFASTELEKIFGLIPLGLASSPVVETTPNNAMTLPFDLISLFTKHQQDHIKNNESENVLLQRPPPLLSSSLVKNRKRKSSSASLLRSLHSSSSSASPPDRDLSIELTADSINNLLTVLTLRGNLTFNGINNASTNFTTNFFRPYLPQVFNKCPNCPIVVDVVTAMDPSEGSEPPVISDMSYDAATNYSKIELQLRGTALRFNAVPDFPQKSNSTSSTEELFSLGFSAITGLDKIRLERKTILGKYPTLLFAFKLMQLENVTCVLKKSNVGPIQNTQVLAWVLSEVFDTILIPLIDDILPGLPLPTKLGNATTGEIFLTEPLAQVKDGLAVFGFDVEF